MAPTDLLMADSVGEGEAQGEGCGGPNGPVDGGLGHGARALLLHVHHAEPSMSPTSPVKITPAGI